VEGTDEPGFALYGLHFVPLPAPPGGVREGLAGREWIVFGWNRGEVSLEISGDYRFEFGEHGRPRVYKLP